MTGIELPRSASGALQTLIRHGYHSNASDIHLETACAARATLQLRMRIDGALETWCAKDFPQQARAMLIAHIKTISGMDTTQSTLPQDGAFGLELKAEQQAQAIRLDIRVSAIPSVSGERLVAAPALCAPGSANTHRTGFVRETTGNPCPSFVDEQRTACGRWSHWQRQKHDSGGNDARQVQRLAQCYEYRRPCGAQPSICGAGGGQRGSGSDIS